MHSPLEHFEVVFAYTSLLSNCSQILLCFVSVATVVLCIETNYSYVIRGRYRSIGASLLLFSQSVVYAGIGNNYFKYARLLLSLYFFLFLANVTGLFPYAFAITGQLSTTLLLSSSTLLGVTTIGILTHGKHFATAFIPSGAPGSTLLLLNLLETASYAARPLSLGIRLFANVMAGHALTQILATLVYAIIEPTAFGLLVGLLSGSVVSFVMLLETIVAALQAYVFLLLVSIYFNDAVRSVH